MAYSTSRTIALRNLQWRVAHGLIGLRAIREKDIETPYLNDLVSACEIATNGKGLQGLVPNTVLSEKDSEEISSMITDTKRLIDDYRHSNKKEEIDKALIIAERLFEYIDNIVVTFDSCGMQVPA